MLREILQRRVGLRRARDVGLVRGALDRGGRQRRARPRRCPARPARGATRCVAGGARRPRARGRDRRQGAAAAAPGRARRRARRRRAGRAPTPAGATRRSPPSCARPPRPASCSPATTALLPLARRAAPRRRARAERRRRPHAGRRQRDGLPALHGVAARGPARRAGARRRRTRRGVAAPDTPAPGRAAPTAVPGGVRVRFLDADGSELASEQRRGAAFTWLGTLAGRRHVAAVEVRATLRAPTPGEHVVGGTGVGRHRLDARRRGAVRRRRSSCRRARTSARPSCARRSTAVPVTLDAGDAIDARAALRARRREPASPPFQLNVEPPSATTRPSSSAPSRWPPRPTSPSWWSAPPRRSRARASTATTLALPGRQDELVAPRRGRQPAHRRGRQRRRAGAAAVGRRGAGDPARLVPRPGVRQRARRRATGAVEPGGRLPTTWPRDRGGPAVDRARSTAC